MEVISKGMYLPLTDGHTMYYEEHGNPQGEPVVVLHGGPGGGLQRFVTTQFDLKVWRVIMFDQRGCGKSTPFGLSSLKHNTTRHLIGDIERLRVHLGIKRWSVFGGSWGSTLALAYAQRYPATVKSMILRGICLMDTWEQHWMYGSGDDHGSASTIFPKEWDAFVAPIKGARSTLRAYRRKLTSRNRTVRRNAARAWWGWESALSTLKPTVDRTPADKAESISIIENHYFLHNAWIRPGQLLRGAARIRHIPTVIVQGRFDMVCPMRSAVALSKRLPQAELVVVEAAGHASSEPGVTAALRAATNKMSAVLS